MVNSSWAFLDPASVAATPSCCIDRDVRVSLPAVCPLSQLRFGVSVGLGHMYRPTDVALLVPLVVVRVLRGVLVALWAMGRAWAGFHPFAFEACVRAVAYRVLLVFTGGAPAEVFQPVVEVVPVPVEGFHPVGAGADEGFEDKPVHFELAGFRSGDGGAPLVVSLLADREGDDEVLVPFSSLGGWFEERAVAVDAANISVVADEVARVARQRYPTLSHVNNITIGSMR